MTVLHLFVLAGTILGSYSMLSASPKIHGMTMRKFITSPGGGALCLLSWGLLGLAAQLLWEMAFGFELGAARAAMIAMPVAVSGPILLYGWKRNGVIAFRGQVVNLPGRKQSQANTFDNSENCIDTAKIE